MSQPPVPVIRPAGTEGGAGRSFRFRNVTVAPNDDPDAEPTTLRFVCAVCEESGPEVESQGEAEAWALGHLKHSAAAHDGPHYSYLLHMTRPFQTRPGRWL